MRIVIEIGHDRVLVRHVHSASSAVMVILQLASLTALLTSLRKTAVIDKFIVTDFGQVARGAVHQSARSLPGHKLVELLM